MVRALTGLALVLAAVLAIVLLARVQRTGTPQTGQAQPPEAGRGSEQAPAVQGPAVRRPVKIVLECERPTVLEDKDSAGRPVMRMGSVTLGETVGYLEIPDGWIKDYGYEKVKESNAGGALPGKAFYDFEAPREGDYYIFLRAQWMDSCGDSVFLRVDDGPYRMIEDTEGQASRGVYQWAWHPLRAKGEPQAMHLAGGKHRFELATREDGPKFDRILLATDAGTPSRDTVDP